MDSNYVFIVGCCYNDHQMYDKNNLKENVDNIERSTQRNYEISSDQSFFDVNYFNNLVPFEPCCYEIDLFGGQELKQVVISQDKFNKYFYEVNVGNNNLISEM